MANNKKKSKKPNTKNSREEGLKQFLRHTPMGRLFSGEALRSLKRGVRFAKTIGGGVGLTPVDEVYHSAKAVIDQTKSMADASKQRVEGLKKLFFNHPVWYKSGNHTQSNLLWSALKGSRGRGVYSQAAGLQVKMANTIPGRRINLSTPEDQEYEIDATTYASAIDALHTKLAGSNTTEIPFSVGELAAYVETASSLISMIAHASKQLKAVKTYNTTELLSPSAITLACGIPARQLADIKYNRANYIEQLNQIIDEFVSKMPVPINDDNSPLWVYHRKYWLYSNVFIDQEDPDHASYIACTPISFNWFNGTTFASEEYELGSNSVTFKDYLDKMSSILASIRSDSRLSQVPGYIWKAYSERASLRGLLSLITLEDTQDLVYDPAIINQLRNATVFQNYTSGSVPIGYWNNNTTRNLEEFYTYSAHTVVTETGGSPHPAGEYKVTIPINWIDNDPDFDVVSSITRLAVPFSVYYGTENTVTVLMVPDILNTELCVQSQVYSYLTQDDEIIIDSEQYFNTHTVDEGNIADLFTSGITQINGAPMLRLVLAPEQQHGENNFIVVGDVNCLAPYTATNAYALSAAIWKSLYYTIDIVDQTNFKIYKK